MSLRRRLTNLSHEGFLGFKKIKELSLHAPRKLCSQRIYNVNILNRKSGAWSCPKDSENHPVDPPLLRALDTDRNPVAENTIGRWLEVRLYREYNLG